MSNPSPPRPGPARTLLAVPVVVLPAALGVGAWLWQDDERDHLVAAQQEDEDALRAATHQVLAWASVDYREIDDYFQRVEAGATGEFLDEFTQTEPTLRQGLRQNRSLQVPTVPRNGSGLLERTGDVARVVVAFDAVVTNLATEGKPQPRQYRMQVTVQKVDGTWKISKLEYVG